MSSAPEPLSEAAIEDLLSSEGFYRKARDPIARRVLYENQLHEKNIVEHAASPEDLLAILRHIEEVWKEYGKRDPHWSVVTAPEYRSGEIDQNLARFHRSGQKEIENLKRLLSRCDLSPGACHQALEYGCGVGRVTRWLAELFPSVCAVDISENHLALAKDYLQGESIENVIWTRISALEDIDRLPAFDFLYTKIVLQHNPPPVIRMILERLCRTMQDGGIGVVQVPTYRKDYVFKLTDYMEDMDSLDRMEMHVLPQPVVFDVLDRCDCRLREVSRDHYAPVDYVSTTFVFAKGERGP